MIGLSALSPDMMFGGGEDELMGGPAFGDILRAVEWQESRGRDDAVSPKGAFGAMQLMPGAVMDYARAHGLPTDPGTIESLRRDPAKNREIGAWYLEQVQGQFGGDIVPALAAYNAGPGRVKQILAGFGGEYSPAIRDEFISRLPAETRGYIASIENRLGQPQPGAPPMPQVPYDEDQGLANIAAMGQRVGQMQPAGLSALQPRPQQAQGLSALSPYLEIARQLSPTRESNWGDALVNAGAAMMQSQRPDFLGGLGAGLQAGNQTMMRGREQNRADTLNQFKLGMELARFDQKDGGEFAMSDGVLYNKKTGATQQVAGDKPMSDIGKLQADLRAKRISPEEYEAAISKLRGEGESPVSRVIREMGLDPNGPEAQELRRKYAERVGGGATVNIDNKAETEFAKQMAKFNAETYSSILKGAADAPNRNSRLDRLEQLLDGVTTGKYATSLMDLQKGLTTILGAENAPKIYGKSADVAQAEAAQALSNEIALSLRNPAGGEGMPGALSDRDREFLMSMVPGVETTAEGRKKMIATAKALNNRAAEVAKLAARYKKDNGDRFDGFEIFLADWAEKNPLFTPAERPEAPITKPQSAPMQPPASSLKVTTPTPDGMGTRTQDVPIRDNQSIGTMDARGLSEILKTSPQDPEVLRQIDERLKQLGY